jgi:hypothetical protein
MPPTVPRRPRKARRLEGQALALSAECGFQVGQRRAGAHGHHQLGGS